MFRTNCMDCLDRTNVVQSVIARNILHKQLNVLGIESRRDTSAFERLPEHLEDNFRTVWVKNADIISILYSGTPAMKTDFTLIGKRTLRGTIMDGVYGVKRWMLGNFYDYARQVLNSVFRMLMISLRENSNLESTKCIGRKSICCLYCAQ